MAISKPHQVDETELKKFIKSARIKFTDSFGQGSHKGIYITVEGMIEVEQGGKVIMTTQNTLKATNKYNSLP